jgi:hypothetical protein
MSVGDMARIVAASLSAPLSSTIIPRDPDPSWSLAEHGADSEQHHATHSWYEAEAAAPASSTLPQGARPAHNPAPALRDLPALHDGPAFHPRGHAPPSGRTAAMPKDVVTPRSDIIVSPTFNLIFIAVVALTIVSGVAATALAFAADGSHANQQSIFEGMNFGWKMGLGAIIGLLGGKAT